MLRAVLALRQLTSFPRLNMRSPKLRPVPPRHFPHLRKSDNSAWPHQEITGGSVGRLPSKKGTKTLTAAIAVAFVSLAGSAQAETTGSAPYQPVHPLSWEIPAPGTPSRLPSSTHAEGSVSPKGVSPLGWEIPAPGARGAKAPVRNDMVVDTSFDSDIFQHLGGIGGRNTP